MNVRGLAVLSVLLNAALVVVGWRAGRAPGGVAAVVTEPAVLSEDVRVVTNLTRVELTETNEAAPFHWRQVEVEDLKRFVVNLRAIGCPPESVRAIIESELWARFLPRRRLLLDPFHQRYWELAATGPNIEKAFESIGQSLAKLKEETIDRLDEIAGQPVPKPQRQFSYQQVEHLPESKQRALEDLEQRHNEALGKVRPEQGGKMTLELQAKRDKLLAQRSEAIRALMTPEEYAEYEIRRSSHASVAQRARGFEATPDEMRGITSIYQQFEGADARVDRKDPNAAMKEERAAETKRQREAALKESLSPERYTQFQEGLDGSFQEVYRITERYELPRETASAAASLLKTHTEALRRLREAELQDKQALAQRELVVQAETRAALLRVLGERALDTYEKYQGPIFPVPEADPEQ